MAINIYLLLFLIGYYLTYPTKVFLLNESASMMPIAVILGGTVVLVWLAKDSLKCTASIRGIALSCLLFLLALLYSIAAEFHPLMIAVSGTARKHLVYVAATVPLLIFSSHIKPFQRTNATNSLITILAVAQLCSSAANSIFWMVPQETLSTLDSKYLVGPLLRAGAGYLDPNFLAINFLVLLFIANTLITQRRLKAVSLFALTASTLLTFSRAAWGILLIAYAAYIFRSKSWKTMGILISIVLGAIAAAMTGGDASFLFRRFTDEEGSSSTDDRVFQYSSAIGEIFNLREPLALLFGFGGPDWFFQKYGVHLHNYYMGTVIDSGWPALATLVIILGTVYHAAEKRNKPIVIGWVVAAFFLPSVPDTFYLLIMTIFSQMALTSRNGSRGQN